MELEDLFKDRSQEGISAFAFNTGRLFETIINVNSNNAVEDKKNLQALILSFRQKLADESKMLKQGNSLRRLLLKEFDEHFKIEKV